MKTVETICSFLDEIGLVVHFESIDMPTFLPGIMIRNGQLVVDKDKLTYPGDLLHEAGHLAVMPERIRKNMSGNLDMDPIHHGGELGAMAWSYAACIHLQMNHYIVFHADGYKGGGKSIVDSFSGGNGIGLPLLVWQDMTGQNNDESFCFPKMKNWLCEVDRYQDT